MTKQETLHKGVGVEKFDFTKTFRNQLFLRVSVLYHVFITLSNVNKCTVDVDFYFSM